MEYTIAQPRWLPNKCHLINISKQFNNLIPTIRVESTNLTASYYKQYLGFRVIFCNPFQKNSSILLIKKGNWVFIKTEGTGKQLEKQKISLFFKNTHIEYSKLIHKVRLVKSYCSKDKEKFLIRDCNGIEIAFCSS